MVEQSRPGLPPGLRRAGPDDLDGLIRLQQAAYAQNRVILGVEPLPLQADYAEILARCEVWIVEGAPDPAAALILEAQGADLYIWSISTHPARRGEGLGRALLALAGDLGRERSAAALTLITGERLTGNVAWYRRQGFAITGMEYLPDRSIVQMRKPPEPV